MVPRSYVTDTQSKSSDLAATVLAAASPPQIAAACDAVESFLHKHTPDQTRWFFSITFPTLICKVFGFDDSSSAVKTQSPSGWIDIAALANDSELAGRIFSLLSPNGVLLSSIEAVDGMSLVKYVFPVERLPEWVRYMLQTERDSRVLSDLCPLFKNRLKEDSIKGSSFQVQLNVFEYYMFWFAYYPVCRGNSEGPQTVTVRRSKRFRLENWTYSIPGLSSTKRATEQKNESNLYMRLLYAYLRAYVPLGDQKTHQPYRSSLLQYSLAYDTPVVERAEFLVNALIHFWLVDNDFSPLPVNLCKSFGMSFPFRSVLGETPPTSGLGEVVNVFVKYLNLSSLAPTDGAGQIDYAESHKWRLAGTIDAQSRNAVPIMHSGNSWNSWIQRPLYRYILRTFLYCPLESSIKNASQVFTLWVNYLEPWTTCLEEFTELDANLGMSNRSTIKEVTQSVPHGYSSSWQDFVLANYLYYSSLVMHFIGFSHKFLHTDPEVIVQMVSKVINILTSSTELMGLIKNVDTVFHSKPTGSSKTTLNALHRYVPAIREQLQDWEDGLSESDADGSFLHENWNKDLQLFSDGEDGGQKLLQLFVLRAESELQSIGGENLSQTLQHLDTLKSRLGQLFGGPILKPINISETVQCEHLGDEVFTPRSFGNRTIADIKYKGDWMKRPISDDEIAWLAKLLVKLSDWLNESLGLSQVTSNQESTSWSYVDLSSDAGRVCGPTEMTKVVLCSFISWLLMLCGAGVKFLRMHGFRVNIRVLASKKVVMMLLIIAIISLLKRAFAESSNVYIQR